MPDGSHFHYLLWEDWRNGLYGNFHRDTIIGDSVMLLASPEFANVLTEVAEHWPIATAQHLSDVYRNHQPWCGRAACCFEFGATIREVNTAWATLDHRQQVDANRIADGFTYAWRSMNMEGQMQWPI
jgi:hypothetical protein